MIRWFYPGDEAQQIDWNQLAVYGIGQVADCENSEALRQKLEEIFTPIAPGIGFSSNLNHIMYRYSMPNNERSNKQYDISTKNTLFDQRNSFGEIATRRLTTDLYVHVPLALYGSKEQTYPVSDAEALCRLKKEIAAVEPSARDSMAADILVAWSRAGIYLLPEQRYSAIWGAIVIIMRRA